MSGIATAPAISEAAAPTVRRPLVRGLLFGVTTPKDYPIAIAAFRNRTSRTRSVRRPIQLTDPRRRAAMRPTEDGDHRAILGHPMRRVSSSA